jgi:hypothetical protein
MTSRRVVTAPSATAFSSSSGAQHDVGLAPSRERDGLPAPHRHRLHPVAGRLLEDRDEEVEETRVLRAGRRGEDDVTPDGRPGQHRRADEEDGERERPAHGRAP